jgi:hypothetical protein
MDFWLVILETNVRSLSLIARYQKTIMITMEKIMFVRNAITGITSMETRDSITVKHVHPLVKHVREIKITAQHALKVKFYIQMDLVVILFKDACKTQAHTDGKIINFGVMSVTFLWSMIQPVLNARNVMI